MEGMEGRARRETVHASGAAPQSGHRANLSGVSYLFVQREMKTTHPKDNNQLTCRRGNSGADAANSRPTKTVTSDMGNGKNLTQVKK